MRSAGDGATARSGLKFNLFREDSLCLEHVRSFWRCVQMEMRLSKYEPLSVKGTHAAHKHNQLAGLGCAQQAE